MSTAKATRASDFERKRDLEVGIVAGTRRQKLESRETKFSNFKQKKQSKVDPRPTLPKLSVPLKAYAILGEWRFKVKLLISLVTGRCESAAQRCLG